MAWGSSNDPPATDGGPITRSFEAIDEVQREGELPAFEDDLVVAGISSSSAIHLARGYDVVGPVASATVLDPAGNAVASAGDRIDIEGSATEDDGGTPCHADRGITTAPIAGALGTCTPDECGDD